MDNGENREWDYEGGAASGSDLLAVRVLLHYLPHGASIGFTGTRHGLNTNQWLRLGMVFGSGGGMLVDKWSTFQYGMGPPDTYAVSADEQMAEIVKYYYGSRVVIHGWPSSEHKPRQIAYDFTDEVHEPLPPLVRNRMIVDVSDLLIAAPATRKEVQRSGTWATMRYARDRKVPIIVLWPHDEEAADD